MLLLILCTFTNDILMLFLCVAWPYSLRLTHLITERVYLDDEFSVIYLVDFRALTGFMKSFGSATNE